MIREHGLGAAGAAVGLDPTVAIGQQKEWARRHDAIGLELVRHNSPTAGLCDAAIVRIPVDERRFDSVVVGLERRLVAFASDDPQWSRRRLLSMAEIADRTVIVDPRAGTTSSQLWTDPYHTPRFIESTDVDTW